MIGKLSERYESSGDPGCVSDGWGDAGGVSYGCYQLSSVAGSAQSFVDWLTAGGSGYACRFDGLEPGTDEFSEAWRQLAADDPDGFARAQHDYIQYAYYEPAADILARAGWHVNNHHYVMRDVLWSRAVQYGTGNILEMFNEACRLMGHPNLSYIDDMRFDADLIRVIYLRVCRTEEWTDGSPALRDGLYARFESECQDALAEMEGF